MDTFYPSPPESTPPVSTPPLRKAGLIGNDSNNRRWDSRAQVDPQVEERAVAKEGLDAIRIIPVDEAWQFDTADLLDSPTHIPPQQPNQVAGNNFQNYDARKSLFVLCVVGEQCLHLQLLCNILPTLLELAPALQALIITDSISATTPIIASLPVSLPAVEARGTPPNHFLKLGLLNPLGGGRRPLDAIVIIDTAGRRRLVLPFGWGAGQNVGDSVRGTVVKRRLLEVLEESVKSLENENKRAKADFYDIARQYF